MAYAAPDIVLFDDPLSALDASTGKHIFDQLLDSSRSTLLASSAIVLVTHAAHFLNRVDKILVVFEGSVRFCGTWDELTDFSSDDDAAMAAIEYIRSSVQESSEQPVGNGDGELYYGNDEIAQELDGGGGAKDIETARKAQGTLMTVEIREHGLSSIQTWLLWFKYAGGPVFLLIQVLLMAVDRLAYVGTEVWLARWTQGAYEPVNVFGRTFPPQIVGLSAQYQYLSVYAIILAISFTGTFLR